MADDENESALFAAAREPPPRAVTRVSPMVRRLVAPNPSPFTFNGTCTYIVGQGRVAIVDPGPDDDSHLAALLAAVHGEQERSAEREREALPNAFRRRPNGGWRRVKSHGNVL